MGVKTAYFGLMFQLPFSSVNSTNTIDLYLELFTVVNASAIFIYLFLIVFCDVIQTKSYIITANN